MRYRLYKNNEGLDTTRADSASEAQQKFVTRGAIPADVLKEMKLEVGGPTAVMEDGNVWQIRSLIGILIGCEE